MPEFISDEPLRYSIPYVPVHQGIVLFLPNLAHVRKVRKKLSALGTNTIVLETER